MDHGPSGGSLLETEGIKLDDQHGRGCTVKESDAKGGRSCGCGHRSLYCAIAHLREIKPVSAVCLSYLLRVRD
ncbi:hypothetical protein T4E_271 [Trichinella pseudospiralis]|uniref:Uncharacterized protein n=1 Tax=Trichinella pseudospiralis TaxID=6337 RepID=A0A0V0XHX4_TRIPS|nr:hypothetical protein T4E_271 [Trichinella pseudospiralis]